MPHSPVPPALARALGSSRHYLRRGRHSGCDTDEFLSSQGPRSDRIDNTNTVSCGIRLYRDMRWGITEVVAFESGPGGRWVSARKGDLQRKDFQGDEAGVQGRVAPGGSVWPGGWEHVVGDGCVQGGPHTVKDRVLHNSLREGKAPSLG